MTRRLRLPALCLVLIPMLALPSLGAPGVPDAPDDPILPTDPVAPPLDLDPTKMKVQRMVEALYGDEWTWISTGPNHMSGALDLVSHPIDSGRWVLVRGDLTVWTTADRGRRWQQVFGNSMVEQSSDEDALMGIEARIDELFEGGVDFDSSDFTLDESALDDAINAVVDDAISDAGDQATGDLVSDREFITGDPAGGPAHGRAFYTREGTLFVALGDELHMSINDGRTWTTVLDERVFDVHLVGDKHVALTADGSRVALNPRAWFDILDGTEGRMFAEAIQVGPNVVAAADDGLWATSDGQNWARWGTLVGPVTGIVNHPEQPDQVYAITPQGVVSSSDGARSFSSTILHSGLVTKLTMPVPERLVVLREGAALETLDGGRSWHPLRHGLDRISRARMAGRPDGGLLLATADGAWALIRDQRLTGLTDPGTWVGVETLLDAAQTRDPLRAPNLGTTMRIARYAVPRLRVLGQVGRVDGPQWQPVTGTVGDESLDWRVNVQLEWATGTRGNSTQVGDEPQVVVGMIDNEPFVMSGETSVAAAARLSWVDAKYRSEVAQQVVSMHRTRSELVAERTTILKERLFRRVLHELHIEEVEARLDALTDGAVNRWTAQRATSVEQQ